ncbi:MAG TPA: hypothetical protein VLV81_04010 [Acidimicrobiia bacterium]|nr:hypothetical protein [Acidimicrobiia bacterium]
MRWGRRTLFVVTLLAATALVAPGAARATTARKGSGLSITKPCTYLTAKQVQKVVGAPVTIDPTNRGGDTLTIGCSYLVGPPGQPIGAMAAVLVFPYFSSPGQTAVDVLESQRASDSLSGQTVVDAKIGRSSYANLDASTVVVAPSKKFAFSLQWLPTGSTGVRFDAKTQQQVTTLAKQIAARAPK